MFKHLPSQGEVAWVPPTEGGGPVDEHQPVVVIFTGNSNTGSAVISSLRAQAPHVRIRAVVRKEAKKNPEWAEQGIECVVANVELPTQLEKVFKGDCNVAFWATPATEDRDRLTSCFLDGCIANGVDFPIIISMVGANAPVDGNLKSFGAIEAMCRQRAGTKVKEQFWDRGKQELQPIILQCGHFYENLYAMMPMLSRGTLYYPIAEGKIPMVSIDDVGAVACKVIENPDNFANRSLTIVAEWLDGGAIARAFTMASRGVVYEAVDPAVAVEAFVAAGIARHWAIGTVAALQYYITLAHEDRPVSCYSELGLKHTRFSQFVKNGIAPLLA